MLSLSLSLFVMCLVGAYKLDRSSFRDQRFQRQIEYRELPGEDEFHYRVTQSNDRLTETSGIITFLLYS